jgi:hypothetical protein
LNYVICTRFAESCKGGAICQTFRRKYSRVEAGSSTSTVALRVVEGDKKGCLESRTVKYGHEFRGNRTQEWLRWRGPGATVNHRPFPSSERAPHINKPATVWQ